MVETLLDVFSHPKCQAQRFGAAMAARVESLLDGRTLVKKRILRLLQGCSDQTLLEVEDFIRERSGQQLAPTVTNPEGSKEAASPTCRSCGENRPPLPNPAPWKLQPGSDTATGTICVACRWQQEKPGRKREDWPHWRGPIADRISGSHAT